MTVNRELNPQLFGNQTAVEKIGNPVDPKQSVTGIMGKGSEGQMHPSVANTQSRAVPYPPIDIKGIEHQINTLKVGMIQMEKRFDAMAAKMEEIARSVHNRMERFSQAILKLEELHNHQSQETTGKFSMVAAKMNERKINDTKIQELIDRHNTIVRNFENRLVSLQRVVSEQEMALHNAQATLEEARAELAKPRR